MASGQGVRLPGPVMAGALLLALVAVQLTARNLLLSQFIVVGMIAVATVLGARLSRAGLAPPGAEGWVLASLLWSWLLANAIELFLLLAGLDPVPRPSLIAFVVGAVTPNLLALTLATTTARYSHWSAQLRAGLDTLLIVIGMVCLNWQAMALSGVLERAGLPGVATLCFFAVVLGLVGGSALGRLGQRRDRGTLLLSTAGCLSSAGVYLWSWIAVGIDIRWVGLLLMSFAAFFLIAGMADPSSARPLNLEVGQRDLMGALIFNLGCWVLTAVLTVHSPVSLPTACLAALSIVLVGTRVVLVRTSEARLVRRLRVLAFTDPLTGLGNRRSLVEQLRSHRGWLLSIDLDGFKEINDQHGHDAGDQVLREFSHRLARLAPTRTHLARIGGDEFAVLVDGPKAHARALAEDILLAARHPGHTRLTASVGLSRHAREAETRDTLRDSDIALQEAKKLGGNRIVELTEGMVDRRVRGLEMGQRLAETIESIEVVYQPIVAISPIDDDTAVVAVEALARWSHPERGPVSPTTFIGIAEEQGLVARLGARVMEQVIDQMRVWCAQGAPRQVSVNVSWLQLRDRAVVEQLTAQIARYPQVAKWLVLEVTETVFTEDEVAVDAVEKLRHAGLCIAIDDFGTGASNFRRLRSIPADVLKVDRSFLDGLPHDADALSMLATMARLGAALGMAVIVEGVENRATADVLADLGVTAAQGFLFGRPMPARDLPAPQTLRQPWLPRRELTGLSAC